MRHRERVSLAGHLFFDFSPKGAGFLSNTSGEQPCCFGPWTRVLRLKLEGYYNTASVTAPPTDQELPRKQRHSRVARALTLSPEWSPPPQSPRFLDRFLPSPLQTRAPPRRSFLRLLHPCRLHSPPWSIVGAGTARTLCRGDRPPRNRLQKQSTSLFRRRNRGFGPLSLLYLAVRRVRDGSFCLPQRKPDFGRSFSSGLSV